MPGELGQLIHEQDSPMRKRDLARPWNVAAADETGRRDRVMGSAKRPLLHQPTVVHPDNGLDPSDLDRVVELRRRQDRWDATGKHRLAGTGRADHQDVVATGGGDLERPLRVLLSAYVGEVECPLVVGRDRLGGLRPTRVVETGKEIRDLAQIRHGHRLNLCDESRLTRVLRWEQKLLDALLLGADRNRQGAADAAET